MKTFKKYIFIALLVPFFTGVNHALSIELSKGVLQEFGMSFTAEQRLALPKVTKTIDAFESTGDVMSLAFVNVSGTDEWYRLFDNIKLYGVNVKEEKLLGAWPLTPWAYHLFLSGEYTAAVEKSSIIRGDDFIRPANPLLVIDDMEANYYLHANYPALGCFKNTPLRYGDIDENGQAELVIFNDTGMVFFSPQHGKIIFSYHYELNDELDSEEAKEIFLPPYSDTDPQYIASSGTDNLVREIFPAQRSYSKIYIQDFNGDKKADIVLWRKMYVSNLRNNPVQGFHKLAETWVHYQRAENGEYLPQDTRPETIQNWLNAKNLTWQKGFPSKSECAGEEGKLIPEMHDPLLNDPDVLK